MSLKKKLKKIYSYGHWIRIQNHLKRSDGDWHMRIMWQHIELPSNRVIKECEWFGFDDIEECVDDCLEYLKTLKNNTR